MSSAPRIRKGSLRSDKPGTPQGRGWATRRKNQAANQPEPYGFERIKDLEGRYHFRVRDRDDNRIATCYERGNAVTVTDALNAMRERDEYLMDLEGKVRLMARLASKKPQFDNPLHVWEAERIRDEILGDKA
jgi:hypothetical protein